MHPILFRIPTPWGELPLHTYGFSIMVGFLLGVLLALRKAKQAGIDVNDILDMAMVTMVAGVVGGRLAYVLNFPEEFAGKPWRIFHVWDVLTLDYPLARLTYLAGGIAGAVFGWWFFRLLVRIYVERRTAAVMIVKQSWKKGGKKKEKLEMPPLVMPKNRLTRLGPWFSAAFFAVFCARALYLFADRGQYDFAIINTPGGGLVVYGCILLSISVGVFFVWMKNMPLLRVADLCAPSYFLGLGIGRLGCFFNGCCWGRIAGEDSPWAPIAITFPRLEGGGSPPYQDQWQRAEELGIDRVALETQGHSMPVIPSQLIDAALLCLLFAALHLFYYNKNRRNGDVMFLFGALYSIERFCIEFLRSDNPLLGDGLTIAQNISFVTLALTLGLWAWTRTRFQPGRPFDEPVAQPAAA